MAATAPPVAGLGADLAKIKGLCGDDMVALDLIDRVVQRKHGGDGSKKDNITLAPQSSGNTRERIQRSRHSAVQVGENSRFGCNIAQWLASAPTFDFIAFLNVEGQRFPIAIQAGCCIDLMVLLSPSLTAKVIRMRRVVILSAPMMLAEETRPTIGSRQGSEPTSRTCGNISTGRHGQEDVRHRRRQSRI